MSNIRYDIVTAHGWLAAARDSFDEGRPVSYKRAKKQLEKVIPLITEAITGLDTLVQKQQANFFDFEESD